jgi:ketosteroid isomerase-like protein
MPLTIRCLLLVVLLGVSPLVLADEAADRAAIEVATQAWFQAFNARDLDALAALTTSDVMLMDTLAASPVTGREAARAAWVKAFAASKAVELTTSTAEVVIAGDVAWRTGVVAQERPKGNVVGRGQILEIWKRVNGAWRLHRQVSSRVLPQPKLIRQPPSAPVLDRPD